MPKLPEWKTPIERQRGWEQGLVSTVERHMAQPFAWGLSDCLIVAADVCDAMCGRNPLPAKLRHYRTEIGAMKLLRALGFADTAAALAAVFPGIPVLRARRGDCGVADQIDGPACYIVLGAQSVGKGADGPVYIATARLKAAFAIGAP